jgi:hypothetical protein
MHTVWVKVYGFHAPSSRLGLQVRTENLWRSTRQQEERRATTPGLLSKLRKNMGSGGGGGSSGGQAR